MLHDPVAVGDRVTPPAAVDGAPAGSRPSDGATLTGLPGAGELHLWATPLRVNLRYEPRLARLRLRGALTAVHTTELVRILGILDLLPAPVEIDLREVTELDGGGAAIVSEAVTRRRRAGAPAMVVRHPGAFGTEFAGLLAG